MKHYKIRHHYGLFFLVLISAGCDNNLAQVSGLVTVDGRPFEGGKEVHATVFFQPTSGQGASAVGVVDDKGKYYLTSGSQEGVEPGIYVVTVSASKIIFSNDQMGTPIGKQITNPKYASAKTSGIKFEVKEGQNQCDIPLESP